MKRITQLSLLLLLPIVLFVAGCSKEKMKELNIDPNNPVAVPDNLLLPSAQAGMAYALGGDVARFVSIFMQQTQGTDRQFEAIDGYSFTEGDTDNLWRFNFYGGAMNDLHILIGQADASGNKHYAGIARLLMAHSLMQMTDLFGAIPYSDAFKGAATLKAKYDTQEAVYASIRSLIAAARTDLSGAGGGLLPAGDDLIYGGDTDQWLKFADVLEARSWLHVALRDNTAYAKALAAITAGKGFASSGDNATFIFGTSQTSAGPWYQFVQQRAGYISYPGNAMGDLIASLSDPRDANFATIADGGETGLGAPNAALVLASYAEQKFIEAECLKATGDNAGAKAAYLAGIQASMNENGVTSGNAATYLAQANVDIDAANLTMENIMTQKYLALFASPEVFNDWRRTGFPTLTPTVVGGKIPVRFPHPESERLYNGENLPANASSPNEPVWWDAN